MCVDGNDAIERPGALFLGKVGIEMLGGTLHVKKEDNALSECVTAHPVKAMKLMSVKWMHADHNTNLPFSEGSEEFTQAGNGKALPGCSSSYAMWTIDELMEDFAEHGNDWSSLSCAIGC